jgi:Ca-activated chloride channel family protein
MKSIKYLLWLIIILPVTASAWTWMDLWRTPDQHGANLMHAGKSEAAVRAFKDKNWRGVALYRSGSYDLAYKQFSGNKTSDGQYNAGNAAAFAGNYQDAIAAYDKAIALNSNNTDAVTNREIVKKLLEQKKQQDQKNKYTNNNKNDKNDKKNSDKNSDQQKQQDAQKNSLGDSKQQSAKNQSEKNQQQSGNQKQNTKTTTADTKQQKQDENGKQLLRRITDDPGGLLQQKFLRDYARRHEGQDDQGVN